MKLPQRQVADPLAQTNFEKLQGVFPVSDIADGAVTAAKLATGIVLELATTGTRRKFAAGSSSATWTAAVLSAAVVIPHGLGAAPIWVDTQTQSQLFDFKVTADATNLTVTGFRTDGTNQTGSVAFYWAAVG